MSIARPNKVLNKKVSKSTIVLINHAVTMAIKGTMTNAVKTMS